RAHRDGPHHAVAELLLDFEGQAGLVDPQSLVDLGHVLARELHVDHGADDLHDSTGAHRFLASFRFRVPVGAACGGEPPASRPHAAPTGEICYTAAAPPTISAISCVMAAWRALL